jgi:hypothetical protein
MGIEVLIREKSTRSRVAPLARFSIFAPTADGLATQSQNKTPLVPLSFSTGVSAAKFRF